MKAKIGTSALAGLAALVAVTAEAEVVTIIAKPPGIPTSCPVFCETSAPGTWSSTGSTAHSAAPGDNATGSVFAPGSVVGIPQCTITPALAHSNAVYEIDVTHTGLNASSNIIIALSVTGGTLSTNQTVGFQSTHGVGVWYLIAFLTNTSSTPTITFTYLSGDLAALGGRWYVDGFRFSVLDLICQTVPQIGAVDNPLAPGQTFVSVPNVRTNAINVTVYADDGVDTTVQIGSLSVTNATNAIVTVAPLANGNYICATQWMAGAA